MPKKKVYDQKHLSTNKAYYIAQNADKSSQELLVSCRQGINQDWNFSFQRDWNVIKMVKFEPESFTAIRTLPGKKGVSRGIMNTSDM